MKSNIYILWIFLLLLYGISVGVSAKSNLKEFDNKIAYQMIDMKKSLESKIVFLYTSGRWTQIDSEISKEKERLKGTSFEADIVVNSASILGEASRKKDVKKERYISSLNCSELVNMSDLQCDGDRFDILDHLEKSNHRVSKVYSHSILVNLKTSSRSFYYGSEIVHPYNSDQSIGEINKNIDVYIVARLRNGKYEVLKDKAINLPIEKDTYYSSGLVEFDSKSEQIDEIFLLVSGNSELAYVNASVSSYKYNHRIFANNLKTNFLIPESPREDNVSAQSMKEIGFCSNYFLKGNININTDYFRNNLVNTYDRDIYDFSYPTYIRNNLSKLKYEKNSINVMDDCTNYIYHQMN